MKSSFKHIVSVSAVILAMVGAGSGLSNVNASHVHTDQDIVTRDSNAIRNDQNHMSKNFLKDMNYYNDLQNREKSLRKVMRSSYASRSAKRHARKLLKKTNKNIPRSMKSFMYYMDTYNDLQAKKADLKKASKQNVHKVNKHIHKSHAKRSHKISRK